MQFQVDFVIKKTTTKKSIKFMALMISSCCMSSNSNTQTLSKLKILYLSLYTYILRVCIFK
jgi:hypothetical protein